MTWTFPLSETYWAFGDGSETDAGAFYGIFLLPEYSITQGTEILKKAKLAYNVAESIPLHGRKMFAGDQRRRSEWSHLSYQECAQLCSDVLDQILDLNPLYMLTHYPIEHFPKRFRLKGKNGHPDAVHAINSKWMVLWSYLQTAGLLDPAKIIPPPNPLVTPRPRNLPRWDMEVKRTDPGPRVSAVYLDREATMVPWVSKRFQWQTVANLLTIENKEGKSLLPIVNTNENKHSLIEIADIFIYSIAKELSGRSPLPMTGKKATVLVMIRGAPVEEMVFGESHK